MRRRSDRRFNFDIPGAARAAGRSGLGDRHRRFQFFFPQFPAWDGRGQAVQSGVTIIPDAERAVQGLNHVIAFNQIEEGLQEDLGLPTADILQIGEDGRTARALQVEYPPENYETPQARMWLEHQLQQEWTPGVQRRLRLTGVTIARLANLLPTTTRWWVMGVVQDRNAAAGTSKAGKAISINLHEYIQSSRATDSEDVDFYFVGPVYVTPIPMVEVGSSRMRIEAPGSGFEEVVLRDTVIDGNIFVPAARHFCFIDATVQGCKWLGFDDEKCGEVRGRLFTLLNSFKTKKARKRVKTLGVTPRLINKANEIVAEDFDFKILLTRPNVNHRHWAREWSVSSSDPAKSVVLGLIDFDGMLLTAGSGVASCQRFHYIAFKPSLIFDNTISIGEFIPYVQLHTAELMKKFRECTPHPGSLVSEELESAKSMRAYDIDRKGLQTLKRSRATGAIDLSWDGNDRDEIKEPVVLCYDLETYIKEEAVPSPEATEATLKMEELLRQVGIVDEGGFRVRQHPCVAAWMRIDQHFYKPDPNFNPFNLGLVPISVTTGEGCIEAMIKRIEEEYAKEETAGRRIIAYAHNGSKFDTWVMLMNRAEYKLGSNFIQANGGILKCTIELKHKCKLELRCSYRLIPSSLSAACDSFGVPDEYIKKGFPVDALNEDNWETLRSDSGMGVVDYCKYDVLSLGIILVNVNAQYKSLYNDLIDEAKMPVPYIALKLTAPAMALDIFRRCYQEFPIEVPYTHPMRETIRTASRGGHLATYVMCYCNELGAKALSGLDVTSRNRYGLGSDDANSLVRFSL